MKFLKSAILSILNLKSVYHVWLLRMRGCIIGSHCKVLGFPYIRLRKGAQVIMENNSTLISAKWANRMLNYPITIDAVGADSKVIFRKYAGATGSMFISVGVIDIGDYTMIAPGCTFNNCQKAHSYSSECGWLKLSSHTENSKIIVGKRCFIGMNSIIHGDVTIGDNCVIAAGTVITKDVPAGHFANGNPAVYTPLPKALRKTPEGYVSLGKI